ncbi:MAG: DUF4190 domain-containing protein [Pirellulaceae bacterium]
MAEQLFAEDSSVDQFREYKPLCKTAVAAFGCALIGCLAAITPMLIAFEFVAIVLAFVALGVIKQQARAGKTLAVLALLSSGLVIGFIPSREIKRRHDYAVTACEHATSWVKLIQEGRFQEAHQLTYYFTERRAPGVAWAEHYRESTIDESMTDEGLPPDMDAHDAFTDYFSHSPGSWLRSEHKKLKFSLIGITSIVRKPDCILLTVDFDVQRPNGATKLLQIEMQRTTDVVSHQNHWRVNAVTEDGLTDG